MSKIWAIINKELKAHLDNLGGYLLIGLFLAIIYYLFLKTFFVNAEVSVQTLFSDLSWLVCVFVAAVTMNSFAGERDKQTIEYLVTKPITTLQLLWGKILGNFIYALIPILLTLPIPLFVGRFGALDGGEVFAGYLAAIVMTFALVCLGVAFSALVKKPVVAFLLSAVVLLILNLISSSFFAVNLNPALASFVSHLGLMEHYFALLRGVLSFNDLAYFILLALVGVTIGYFALSSWRFGKVKLSVGTTGALVAVTAVLVCLSFLEVSWLQFRFDLTARRRYTLSPVTKEIIKEPGNIKIEVYISENLPSQFQSTIQEIKNTLADYSRVGGSQIELNFINPQGKDNELAELGIFATPFSVVSQDAFQQQKGYMGAVIKNEDGSKTQAVNFSNIDGIDYDLTRAISSVKSEEKPKVGYTTGAGEITFPELNPSLAKLLEPEMEFEAVELPSDAPEAETEADGTAKKKADKEEKTIPDLSQYAALIITQPAYSYTPESIKALHDYYEAGGKILYMIGGNEVNPQLLLATTTAMESDLNSLFSNYGLTVDKNLIQDFQANSIINNGGQGGQFLPLAYAFWPRAQLSKAAASANSSLPAEVTMFWPSSLTLAQGEGWQPLYQTTKYGVATAAAEMISVEPATEPVTTLPGIPQQYTLAAARPNAAGGKLVVIANPLLFADQLLNGPQAQSNIVLGMVTLEDLAAARSFSQIQARQISNPRFVADESYSLNQGLLLVGAPLLSVLALVGIGGTRYFRRQNLAKQLASF